MPPLIKTVLIVFIVMGCVILPFYLWNLIDRKSYEDFLLKGVSPLSRESRNEILRQRGAETWFSSYVKKRNLGEKFNLYLVQKKFNPKSEEFLCVPSMNKKNMMIEKRVKSPEIDQSIQEIWWWCTSHPPRIGPQIFPRFFIEPKKPVPLPVCR